MQVITWHNEKGGVGKTTGATTSAAGLAIRGKRVLLIDADAQANATTSLGVKPRPAFYDLMVRDAEWEDVIQEIDSKVYSVPGEAPTGRLFMIPSNIETRLIPMAMSETAYLRERLSQLQGLIDVVMIDTSPTPSLLHSVIGYATDHMIYPTQCEKLSVDGLASTIKHTSSTDEVRVEDGIQRTVLMGVQPMMYRAHTKGHDYGISLLAKQFKNRTWPAIPLRTIWVERGWSSKSIFAYAPEDDATTEAWALVDRIEKGLKNAG